MNHTFLKIISLLILLLGLAQEAEAQQLVSSSEELEIALELLNNGANPLELVAPLDPILFEENSTTLSEEDNIYIARLATLLKKTGWSIEIKGHSDKDESIKFNEKLASERTENVKTALGKKGVSSLKIEANAYSDTKPANISLDQKYKNRRVELILSEKQLEIELADLIILQNEETLGGKILKTDKELIYYKDYTNGKTYKINKSQVKELVKENGEIVQFEKNEEIVSIETPKEIRRRKRKRLNDFEKIKVLGDGFSLKNMRFGFPKPYLFGPGVFVIQGGGNIKTNLGELSKALTSKMVVPPTSVTMEVGVFKNIGFGVSGGVDYWREKTLEFDYQHYTLGARLVWHFQMPKSMNKIDPYFGGAATHHWLFFENDPELCTSGFHPPDSRFSLVNTKWAFDVFGGIRAYWGKRWGVYGEVGSDGLSHYEVGLHYLVSKPKRKVL